MENRLANDFRDVEGVQKNWGWFFALGVLLIILGCSVISSSFYTTIFSMILLGIFLVAGGIIQFVQAFLARKWSGLFLALGLGILYVILGFFCIRQPAAAAISITLLIASFFFIAGLFKMLSALLIRFEQWGWVFFNGLITFILGVMIYENWPLSGLWVIGLFIGIEMILSGASWIAISLTAKK